MAGVATEESDDTATVANCSRVFAGAGQLENRRLTAVTRDVRATV
jgi:hypothetical protein